MSAAQDGSNAQLAGDVAYVRTLANEGRYAPLIGGAFLVMFGTLLTIAYALHWALLTNRIFSDAGPLRFAWLWMGFGALATMGVFIVRLRMRALPGASSIGNRIDRAVWRSVGLAIIIVVIGAFAHALIDRNPEAPDVIMAAGFGFYGVALNAAATASDQAWLRGFSLLSLALSLALWSFLSEPWTYLAAAGGSVLVLLIPGLILMRREPSPVA